MCLSLREGRILANFAEEFAFLIGDGGLRGGAKINGEVNDMWKPFQGIASAVSALALPIFPFFGATRNVMPGWGGER